MVLGNSVEMGQGDSWVGLTRERSWVDIKREVVPFVAGHFRSSLIKQLKIEWLKEHHHPTIITN